MADKLTVPAKLLTLLNVKVVFAGVPTTEVSVFGWDETEKPTSLTVTLTEWTTLPDVPVIIMR